MTEPDWAGKGIKAAGSGGRAGKTLLARRLRSQHPHPSLDTHCPRQTASTACVTKGSDSANHTHPLWLVVVTTVGSAKHTHFLLHLSLNPPSSPYDPSPAAETSVGVSSEPANGQQPTRLRSPLWEAQALDLCLFLGLPQADFYILVCFADRGTWVHTEHEEPYKALWLKKEPSQMLSEFSCTHTCGCKAELHTDTPRSCPLPGSPFRSFCSMALWTRCW